MSQFRGGGYDNRGGGDDGWRDQNSGGGGYHQNRGGGYGGEGGRYQGGGYDAAVEALFDTKHNTGINFDKYANIPVEVSPQDPNVIPLSNFTEVNGIHQTLQQNIHKAGYKQPTPVQKYAIPYLMAGKDIMACAQTGSGKTAAFLFPCINYLLWNGPPVSRNRDMCYPYCLVLAPTRELATQIQDEARKFTYQSNLKVTVVYGGADYKAQFRALERGVEILVATPGRLMDHIERAKVGLSNIAYLVLDEADRMLDMGFEPQIREIVQKRGLPRRRQTMMCSATFPSSIQRLAAEFLHDYTFLTVGRVGSTNDFITQKLVWSEDNEKRNFLLGILAHRSIHLTLVFVNTKQEAQSLDVFLRQNGIPTTSIHGDRSQSDREAALADFKSGRYPVLVATDVAARGLDIPNVTLVVQYDTASNVDDYVHRIGRTGRAGNFGLAISFLNNRAKTMAAELIQLLNEADQEVPAFLHGMAIQSGAYVSKKGGANFGGQDFRKNVKGGWDPNKNKKESGTFANFDQLAYVGQ